MSAAEALRAARAAGVTVMPDGESLVLEAKDEPSKAVLDALSRHKLAILALLRSGQDVWTAEDWRARFEERTAFLEHDGGLSRVDAEVHAFEHCIIEWLNANPSASPAGCCTWCGKAETLSATVLPFGVGEHHAWLHAECWPAWHQSSQADAALALRRMGIGGWASLWRESDDRG